MIAGMSPRRRPVAAAALALLAAGAAVALWGRGCGTREEAARSATTSGGDPGSASARAEPSDTWAGAGPSDTAAGPGRAWELPLPTGSEGWEEAAVTVAFDLRRLLLGQLRGGAYEEARAEAARQDLALFPPDPWRLRRLLLSPAAADRTVALAALAARAETPDDLVRIALRSARPEDDELVRLLGAELAAALPPEQLARHEEDLLRAFEREPNPLVLAVALPALERLAPERVRALIEGQLAVAAPEMVPILVAVARDRLGPDALRSVGVLVVEQPLDAER